MGFAPIVERELRLLSRRPSTYRIRALTALGATLIGFGVAFTSVSTGGTAALLGRNLFTSMTVLAFVAAVMTGPVLTADCLSEEKRKGTLGLLFLAGLKGYQVVAGKLVALSLPAVYCLVAVFPIMGFSFFVGGVTGGEFARVALVLTETLLFSLASAMAISAVSREGMRALGGSAILVLFVIVGLPGLALWWSSAGYAADRLALPSPLLGLQHSEAAVYDKSAAQFWWAFSANLALSCILLTVASLCVPYSWSNRPVRAPRRAWFKRPFTRSPANSAASARQRRLLDDDPLVGSQPQARQFLRGVAARRGERRGWSFRRGCARSIRNSRQCDFRGFHFLHAALKVMIAWDASRRFASDRESGALELLPARSRNAASGEAGWSV
jgi:ABC-type transport system involved in multi-copper enzyme maturation permease subunit